MASAKIATLLIRTIAKPISAQIKRQAKEDVAEFVLCCFVFCVSSRHERFRNFCVSLAQLMYRTEVRLRTGILGEPAKHIRPLSETKAIDSGANALAEGFLFSVAAALILGESYRSARNETKRRGGVDERLGVLEGRVGELERELGRRERVGVGERERVGVLKEVEERKEERKEGKEQGKEGKDDASQKNS
ncbi:optic atrophy 3 protein-domain-containing protein [Lentinula edodes]|nr:optic atrophy 3 protein-domain-containing protein [Lentinula edodes]